MIYRVEPSVPQRLASNSKKEFSASCLEPPKAELTVAKRPAGRKFFRLFAVNEDTNTSACLFLSLCQFLTSEIRITLECSHKGIFHILTLQSHTKPSIPLFTTKIYEYISTFFSHFYLFLPFHSHNSQTDGNGDPDEVQLDEEMEKVFAGPDRDKDKFDVSQLTSVTEGKAHNVATKFQDHDVDGGYFS